jgi:hypothetical protein
MQSETAAQTNNITSAPNIAKKYSGSGGFVCMVAKLPNEKS